MKIQLYSDLHIEFEAFEARLENADVVVFAGDIEVGKKGIEWLNSLDTEKPIIYVLGNHEYYKHTYPKLLAELKSHIARNNIHLLENESVTIDNITFHGCTLWTDFELFGDPPMAGFACQQVMNDFKKIRRLPNYSKLRPMDASAIHRRSLKWLGNSLDASTGHNVVVTHHAPSLRSVAEHYKNDIITAGYASDLEWFINQHKPVLWLHGHLHSSSDYQIAGCRVVCNPRGYKGEFNPEFEPEKIIEVG